MKIHECEMGIAFNQDDWNFLNQQLDSLILKARELNTELDKIKSNEILKNMNGITINTDAFMGNEHDAKNFAKLVSEYINSLVT